MKLIDQHTKKIMEECKERAQAAGLSFGNETLEYIVSNKDMLELSPKVMIPTLYDYWVHDVEVLKEYGKYKAYPSNPYETVINSRPAISFYNDNNPDWLNIMIFYHVLGHIDFFQNNILFAKTWNDDFVGQALSDKRLIASLRSEYGRWLDYVIEFSRSIDNISGYFSGLVSEEPQPPEKVNFYFDVFLQDMEKIPQHEIYKEILAYNKLIDEQGPTAEAAFFAEVKQKHPEFEAIFSRASARPGLRGFDLLEFIRDNSPFLRNERNAWMKSVMTIIRNTSLYFGPQIRTKILNEGWASYWHDTLFRQDDRIRGHEVAYAKINAGVTSISRVGLNPYAIGLRLIQYVEELADKGKLHYLFQKSEQINFREEYNSGAGEGKKAIFDLRENFSDFTLINSFCTQEFVDEHNLFVVGTRLNQEHQTVEYYVKSRKGDDYKKMLIDSLYHPPHIEVDLNKTDDENLFLRHHFEGKQLIKDFIPDTLIGIEFLWGGQVQLETTEIVHSQEEESQESQYSLRKVIYTVKDKKVNKSVL